MKKLFMTALICAVSILSLQTTQAFQMNLKKNDVTTVSSVDLKRYSGKWYEIAKLPNKFQKQCVGNVTADYVLNADGNIEVTNRCLKKDGKYDDAKGKAKIVDKQSKDKLEVRSASADSSPIPLAWGDYKIIELEPNYQYVVLGNPDHKYLWILSRTPEMNDTTYQNILRKLEKMGYDPNKLVKTPQKVETLKGTVVDQKQ